MDEVIIRTEKKEDYEKTENVTREAFWNVYCPGCTEHYMIHIMRENPMFIPDLDFVAVINDEIVGNVMCTQGHIITDHGQINVVSLGPISVIPSCQRKGIGGLLIKSVQKAATAMGFPAILLCGDPNYYSRHGFLQAAKFGIRTENGKYAAALHVLQLKEGFLNEASGRYIEPQVYQIDEKDAEAFDKNFPRKEKLEGTASQGRFNEIQSMTWD
ncbi:N-acetyltransferase [Histomonas meleagridis]|uniref:N-acetyltransferase n=1 Tax=Histomonas meleagridis TaxID=135588 RepID=UPI003559428C|nr:N-acetyltransferase [Histomonas meleagridis]KAH0801533.1 N-acetyltransferase [Histomonas meleagridis]